MLSIFLSRLQGALSSHYQSICIEVSNLWHQRSTKLGYQLSSLTDVHTTSTVIYWMLNR